MNEACEKLSLEAELSSCNIAVFNVSSLQGLKIILLRDFL